MAASAKFWVVFIVVALCGYSSMATSVIGVRKSRAQYYTGAGEKFTCLDSSKTIAFSSVNDDFCDCADGTDEPGTSACPNGEFYCKNQEFEPSIIPSSRINDGICDCCDGSDEAQGVCSNTCKQLALEKQRMLEESTKITREGFLLRAASTQRAKAALELKKQKLEALTQKLAELESGVEIAKAEKELTELAEKQALSEFESASEHTLLASRTTLRSTLENVKDKLQELEKMISSDEMDIETLRFYVNGLLVDVQSKLDSDLFDPNNPPSAVDPAKPTREYPSKEVAAAQDARTKYNRIITDKDNLAHEMEELLKEVNSPNYGTDLEFYELSTKCIQFETTEYIYELCPFKKVTQKTKAGTATSLGEWDTWSSSKTMSYTKGQQCWQGPQRSTKVDLVCGNEEKLVSVSEPAKCEYYMKLITPSVCEDPTLNHPSRAVHDEL